MRIASLSPAVTEILFALGVADQLVCVDQFSDFPEEARDLPRLMGHQRVDLERLRAHKPDVVFTSTVVQAVLAAQLATEGFSVVHRDPRRLSDVHATIRELGTFVDRSAEAHALSERMRLDLAATEKLGKLLPPRMRIYIEEWHAPPMASGNWVPELAKAAGGEAFPIPAGELSRAVTLDEVTRFDPDVIVISWCGAGRLADKALLTGRPGWEALRAVRENSVFVVDDSLLNRPGPRVIEGAKRLYGLLFQRMH